MLKLLCIVALLLVGCRMPARERLVARPVIVKIVPKPVKPKLLVFSATWCGPCQRAKPAEDAIEASGIEVIRHDIDEEPELGRRYGITAVPTFIVVVGEAIVIRTHDIDEARDELDKCR